MKEAIPEANLETVVLGLGEGIQPTLRFLPEGLGCHPFAQHDDVRGVE
jgi:hypothetical protein